MLPDYLIVAANRLLLGDDRAVRALTGRERAAILCWLGITLIDALKPEDDQYDTLLAGVLALIERSASPERTDSPTLPD